MRFISAALLVLGSFTSVALAASLTSGLYNIKSSYGDTIVGRSSDEDLSLEPKKVVVNSEAAPWNVTSVGENTYILSNLDGLARIIDQDVFVDLEGNFDEWTIQRQNLSGDYTILSASGEKRGWVLPGNAQDDQVSGLYLVFAPSEPPFFPDNELWKFELVYEYDG